ncbi:LacI family DNA-binding transcriptional regulator [Jiangella muralis]|uniref:LacI family DNA-binding transcriptional regulator n=1 Tax=Jiangella muralis TaxID=702383 RepID=UPI00196A1B3F|nr:LacI family DNA-binding transcriptional regulator [Jiangella muralis]
MNSRRPTMRDVAREAGVALKTVSRVVNNETGVSPQTVERVTEVIHRLGFRRNDMASKLRAGRSAASIGLIIEDLGNPFYTTIARGIETVTYPREQFLVTASSEESAERERAILLELCQRRVNGMIIVPTGLDHSFLQHEIDLGLEVVFLDRPGAGISADTVLLDNLAGAMSATEHLLSLGHRRIAVLGHDETIWTMRERHAGYRAALARAEVAYDESLIMLGPLTPDEAQRATAELLDGANPPTAFFACNNRMTVGVLSELRHRQESIDVAGFDPIETATLFSHPVTLVTYDAAELGRRAAHLLVERLEGRRTPQQVVVPTTLVTYGQSAGSNAKRRRRA